MKGYLYDRFGSYDDHVQSQKLAVVKMTSLKAFKIQSGASWRHAFLRVGFWNSIGWKWDILIPAGAQRCIENNVHAQKEYYIAFPLV